MTKYGLEDGSDRELAKIPTAEEVAVFKQNYLDDLAFSAQVRVLAWLYRQYFGENYQLVERRS
jgi:hypothetical protein